MLSGGGPVLLFQAKVAKKKKAILVSNMQQKSGNNERCKRKGSAANGRERLCIVRVSSLVMLVLSVECAELGFVSAH